MMPGDDSGAGGGAGHKELPPSTRTLCRPDYVLGRSHLRRGRNGHQPSPELATAQPIGMAPAKMDLLLMLLFGGSERTQAVPR